MPCSVYDIEKHYIFKKYASRMGRYDVDFQFVLKHLLTFEKGNQKEKGYPFLNCRETPPL